MKLTTVTVGGPCWAEIATSDPAAAKAFYGELFAWRAETDPRPEAGGYTMMMLGDAPAAGLSPLYGPGQRTGWTVSFSVTDADATVAKVTAAGGRAVMEPMEVLDIGRFAVVADPSGAVFSLWQARSFAGAGVFNDPGALGWVELLTRDTEGSAAFYPAVLGWSVNAGESYTQWGLDGADFGGMLAMGEQFPAHLPPHWLPYFAVADVDVTASRAAGLGGEVVMAPSSIGGVRRIAVLRDPQGGVFGVYQAGTDG
ncbi:VOC family protein [Kitasatospora sp. NPDC057223]|uniref:VOC family protein n=1 Tax=Kitasatospora sp. NPDC057223 TaxID=3346055 RepID=UPI00362C2795